MDSKRLKAQIIVIEQVLLFGMGVAIFLICIMAFNIHNSYFSTIAANDQLNELSAVISSNIVKLSQLEENTDSFITMDIPEKIANREYTIKLDSSGLEITLHGLEELSKSCSIFSLEQSDLIFKSGEVYSKSKMLMIYKKGNEIIII